MVLSSRFLRVTQPNMSGPDVVAVQRRLIALRFYTGPFDGVYTPATQQAVIRFQQAHGLRSDGIVGPATWTALGFEGVQWGGGQYHLIVDTIHNVLGMYDSGRLTATYRVATGKPSTPTPIGDWVIIEKSPTPGGPFGAAWMRLSIPNGAYAIHGTDDPVSIGQSVSHGCIRMLNQDVTQLYQIVPLGTLVTITGQMVTTRLLYRNVPPGTDVAEAQQILTTLRYDPGRIDGQYGPRTEAAVRAFQRDHGLNPDGIVGPQTATALQASFDIAAGDTSP